jgi:hypothetical protein
MRDRRPKRRISALIVVAIVAAFASGVAVAQPPVTVAQVTSQYAGGCSSGWLANLEVMVIDGKSPTDCTVGGGGYAVRCVCDSGAYRATNIGAGVTQSVTCASSGDGSAGALTITPTANLILVTNSDADGCAVTLSETGAAAVKGLVTIAVASNAGGTVDFADSAGVSELAGAFTAAINDNITIFYMTNTWVEQGRKDN